MSNQARGAYCAIAASFMLALMGAAIRLASLHLPNEMVVFLRNAFGLLALLPWVHRQGFGMLATSRLSSHLIRSVAGLAAMYCFFYAIAHLELAEAVLLNFSSPLFIAPIAFLWIGEAISLPVLGAVILGFLGLLLILKPGLGLFSPAAPVGLLSAIFAALAMVSLRRMSNTEPTVRTVFYFTALGTSISAIPLLWAWQTPSLTAVAVMAGAGFFATKGQLLLTHSYSLAPATRIGPYTYSTVVFAAILGWGFWGEVPDVLTIVGGLLVCVSGTLAMTRKCLGEG